MSNWKKIRKNYSIILAADNDDTLAAKFGGINESTANSLVSYLSNNENNLLAILSGKPSDYLLGAFRSFYGEFIDSPDLLKRIFLAGNNGSKVWGNPNPMYPIGVEWTYLNMNPAAAEAVMKIGDLSSRLKNKLGRLAFYQNNDRIMVQGKEQPLVFTAFPSDGKEESVDYIDQLIREEEPNIEQHFLYHKHDDAIDILPKIHTGLQPGKGTGLIAIREMVEKENFYLSQPSIPWITITKGGEPIGEKYLLAMSFGDSGNDVQMLQNSLIAVAVAQPGKEEPKQQVLVEASFPERFDNLLNVIEEYDYLFESHNLKIVQDGLELELPKEFNSLREYQRFGLFSEFWD